MFLIIFKFIIIKIIIFVKTAIIVFVILFLLVIFIVIIVIILLLLLFIIIVCLLGLLRKCLLTIGILTRLAILVGFLLLVYSTRFKVVFGNVEERVKFMQHLSGSGTALWFKLQHGQQELGNLLCLLRLEVMFRAQHILQITIV